MRALAPKLLFVLWSLTIAGLAKAQSCDENSKNCALQFNRTTVTDKLLALASCDSSKLEDELEFKLYPIVPINVDAVLARGNAKFKADKARFAPVSFLRGVCRFHSATARTLSELQKTADFFQRSVTVGLMPAQKSAAALFEGLTHCRAAGTLKEAVDDISPGSAGEASELKKAQNESRDIFCLHRSMAKEAFSEVDWVGFNLDYQKVVSGRSLEDLVKEMSSCGKELLHSSYDSVCGEVTALDARGVNELAREAARSILPNYVTAFKESPKDTGATHAAAPPFTAMMARKLAMTQASLVQSDRNFEDLSKKAQILEAAYEKVLSLYGSIDSEGVLVPAAGGFVSQVNGLQTQYLDTISKVQSLLDLTQRWVDGLYTDNSKQDLRALLLDRQAQLAMQMEFISSEGSGLLTDLGTITDRIEKMAQNSGTQNTAMLKSMCALYFCELRARDPAIFTNSCAVVLNATTRVYDINPLCDHPSNPVNNGMLSLSDGSRRNVRDVCNSAGFNPAEIKGTGNSVVNECMKNAFNPSTIGVTL